MPSPETLRRLAALRPDRGKVVSLYLDLDPSRFGTAAARQTQIQSLLDEAERRYLRNAGLSHEDASALQGDLDRVRRFLNEHLPALGAGGAALFCCGPAGLFEFLRLPHPVEPTVVVDDSPYVEPLAELPDGGRWCVLLVNRRIARILRGSPEELREVAAVADDVPGRHDQGGWSQARFQRHVDKAAGDHVRRACQHLLRAFERRGFDHLVVGCPQEIWGEVQGCLHAYLRDRLVGRIDVDVERATPAQVLEQARPLLEEVEARAERELLDRLAGGLARGDRAVGGLAAVLEALNARRVEVLLVQPGFRAPGVVCRTCGWAAPQADTCPVDGGTPVEREDVVETAVELAVAQSARTVAVRRHPDLAGYGSIAALLRF